MKKIITFSFLLTLIFCAKSKNKAKNEEQVSTYYFIRHAEKDRSDPFNQNPKLTEKGHQRALKWAEYFKNIDFDAVYSSDFLRTKQTATPTADNNNLELTIYSPIKIDHKKFLKETEGQTILIVGHSDSTPKFVNKIIGKEKYPDINDNINANLYVITISNNSLSDSLLVVDNN